MTPWLAARDADPALRDLEATRKVRESVAQSRATVAQFERQFARQGEKWVALRLPVGMYTPLSPSRCGKSGIDALYDLCPARASLLVFYSDHIVRRSSNIYYYHRNCIGGRHVVS